MATKVFLHVGLPKSGTTYLQAVLASNKSRLQKRSRILYPGARWVDQLLAARDILSAEPPGGNPRMEGAWRRLVDEIAAWDGDAVVSMEWLGSANAAQVTEIVETLAPARVEVVVTVRDLARTIPAAWQEFVQNGEVWSWREFLGAITADNPSGSAAGELFWLQQDLGRLLAVWRDALPPEQLHVVTVPQPGVPAGELWARFATVLGTEGSQFDASGGGGNESLGLESADLMLRVNTASRAAGLEWRLYNEMFKQALAKRSLSKRKHRETPMYRLPAELEGWAQARTLEHVRAIEGCGSNVVGDLDDLQPKLPAAHAVNAEPSSEAVLEAAVEGLVALARDRGEELARLRSQLTRLRQENRRYRARGPRARLARLWSLELRPTLAEVSDKQPLAAALRRTVRSVTGRASRQ